MTTTPDPLGSPARQPGGSGTADDTIARLVDAQAKYLCTTDYEGAKRKRERLDKLVADVRAVVAADLAEAEAYIAALRDPLLWHFGTTDPALLVEVWEDNATPEPR